MIEQTKESICSQVERDHSQTKTREKVDNVDLER